MSIYDIAASMGGDLEGFIRASLIALPTRVELSEEGIELGFNKVLENLTEKIKKKARANSSH